MNPSLDTEPIGHVTRDPRALLLGNDPLERGQLHDVVLLQGAVLVLSFSDVVRGISRQQYLLH